MFAERGARLGPQDEMVSSDGSWILGAISPVKGRRVHIHVHIKGTLCVSLRVERTGEAYKQAMLLCVLRRVRDLLNSTNLGGKGPPPNLQGCRVELDVICSAVLHGAVFLSSLSLSCFHSLGGCLQPTLGVAFLEPL